MGVFFCLSPIYLYMAIIKLSDKDLRMMIRECVERVLSESPYSGLDEIESGEELTDAAISKGINLIGYHTTNKPELNNFYKRSAGIHFGSLKAADDRGEMRDWFTDDENWTHKYFLKVRNPLVVEKDFDWERESFDDWSSEEDDKFYNDIDIDYYFRDTLGWDITDYDENGNVLGVKTIKEVINEHGYDCIIYRNEREDVGNYSIAMFEPNNIKLACETSDDDGTPIPIEDRFNTNTDDVRY